MSNKKTLWKKMYKIKLIKNIFCFLKLFSNILSTKGTNIIYYFYRMKHNLSWVNWILRACYVCFANISHSKHFFLFCYYITAYISKRQHKFCDISLESHIKIILQIYVDLKHIPTSPTSDLGRREGLKKFWRKDLRTSVENYSSFTN